MKKFMDWLANSFAPKMNEICGRPWISAVSSSMQKVIPFILTGSLIYFYNVFRSYIPALPDLGPIADYSFGIISLTLAFVVGQQVMEKLGKPFYTTNCGLVAIAVFLMFVMPTTDEAYNFIIPGGRLGATGIAAGLIAGLFTSIIFNLWSKLKFLDSSTSIPDFVSGWINYIIPTVLCLGISMIITVHLEIDIFEAILSVFSPLADFGQTLPGFVLLCFIPVVLYSMGVSSWLFGAVATPIYLAGIQANIDAVAAGGIATNIATSETVFTAALITMGGMGATLGLNILMMFSKSKNLKTMGRIFIGPSIFNINEPIMFGAPVVFNPILMLPMWINGIVGPTIVYLVMSLGWLNIPATLNQVGQVPVPISTVMITQDFRGIIWAVVLFVIYLFIWYPFFKVYEKECLEKERVEALADKE
ncbi:PTS system cellobiose-specific IIC component [Breznakia sp. PF5-3]|uniref:PTS sugar transporter subunit IIC n=1 Tax=unclassified Breznakia TaxID=2623764 RepID=UPI0024062B84|nr:MULTISPECIES: PTS transporter subunit EIIC [unclassified Breznakia]MDF9824809.1 PTS system cellobiose-specific IIC component [Breznakia sp. PM6-1]MDF9835735.1 PTS system cellobiose-specific IIC component [Breznakia sp. PF5-3]MDF9837821.1 PTS system cellobiose-specific IIC component [Breznakia sp. PFB2-8]MDF9859808.1 PTS system cellobiose-specific IIC component [Breznakia sp. PH5-24]